MNSTPQLRTILFEKLGLAPVKKTKTGPSTDADSLQKMADEHPIVEDLLRYREVEKLRSTYADALPPLIRADGRIHATFKQTDTTTGRISSEAPEPPERPGAHRRRSRDAHARSSPTTAAGCSPPTTRRSSCACSRTSPRIPGLIDAFDRGADVHTTTAAKVFGVAEAKVDDVQRRFAKVVNYGLAYGMEAYGLGQRLDIPTDEARRDPRRVLRRLPERAGVHGARRCARRSERGYTTTIFGRRRQITELSSDNFRIRQMGERMAQNAPVQGSAADIFKLAMIDLDRALDDGRLREPHDAHRARRARARGARSTSANGSRRVVREVMEQRHRAAGARSSSTSGSAPPGPTPSNAFSRSRAHGRVRLPGGP